MPEFKIKAIRRAGRDALVRALKITGRELVATRKLFAVACMHRTALVERNVSLAAALGDALGIIDRQRGFMSATDQELLRNARRVHGGS